MITMSAQKPERAGQLGVVELDAEAGLADHHAERQVDQEAGHAEPGGEPHRADRDQQHGRADQQREVQPGRHRRPARAAVTRPIRRAAGAARSASSGGGSVDREELVAAGRAGAQRHRRRPHAQRVGERPAGRLGGPAVDRRARSPRRPGPGRAGRRSGRRPGSGTAPGFDPVPATVDRAGHVQCRPPPPGDAQRSGRSDRRASASRALSGSHRPHGVKPSSTASPTGSGSAAGRAGARSRRRW